MLQKSLFHVCDLCKSRDLRFPNELCHRNFKAGKDLGVHIPLDVRLLHLDGQTMSPFLYSVEMCAGAGGQALGLEQAGFDHAALVEMDDLACNTLRLNRSKWNVVEGDLRAFDGRPYRGVDLLAGGLPCPPFSKAGKQLGPADERNLFPEAIRLVDEIRPRAVMFENVRGILDAVFEDYREHIREQLSQLGYQVGWRLFNASDFGVSQLRPRVVFVAMAAELCCYFNWPIPTCDRPTTVGARLHDLMAANGWEGADNWRDKANEIAPTLVGGSKKHGGPDLGPTRAKRVWEALGVDGHGVANEAPLPGFKGNPKLTPRMLARLQGFPDDWQFCGKKTGQCRQIGNAFPPPVAQAVGEQIRLALSMEKRSLVKSF
jgi:DNA (cytosine-5)-methyltransferase 1